MSKLLVSVLCLLAVVAQAGASTGVYESFDGSYVNGSIGKQPAGWNFFGYGPPAYTAQETGITSPAGGSAWRVNVPGDLAAQGKNPVGTIAIYRTGVSLDSMALPGETIDWTKPVSLKADVYAADYGYNTQWKTTLSMQSYNRTDGVLEWGLGTVDGAPNGTWQTLTTAIGPNQAGKSGTLVLFLDFNFTPGQDIYPPNGIDAVIWDNIRLDYTAVPEPASIALMGLAGLTLIRRRRAA